MGTLSGSALFRIVYKLRPPQILSLKMGVRIRGHGGIGGILGAGVVGRRAEGDRTRARMRYSSLVKRPVGRISTLITSWHGSCPCLRKVMS